MFCTQDLEVTADDTETVAFTLDNYRTLETEYPHLAKHLHTYIIEMLSGAIKRQVGASTCPAVSNDHAGCATHGSYGALQSRRRLLQYLICSLPHVADARDQSFACDVRECEG